MENLNLQEKKCIEVMFKKAYGSLNTEKVLPREKFALDKLGFLILQDSDLMAHQTAKMLDYAKEAQFIPGFSR